MNSKLEKSLQKFIIKNKNLEASLCEYKAKNKELEANIGNLKHENSELNLRWSSLQQKIKNSVQTKNESSPQSPRKTEEIKNLREKVNYLNRTLRIQITSTNKIDKIRQKLSEKVKLLKNENENLNKSNTQYLSTIRSLEIQWEQLKPALNPEFSKNEDERNLFEKTKGTSNDKDNSNFIGSFSSKTPVKGQDKTSFCSRHIQRIEELEKSNQQLELDLRKMSNISKQETNNLNSIITQALDVLNDISLTIEALSPVNIDYYDDKNLYIEDEAFEKILGQKKYLIDKYFNKSSFSERIK